MSNLYLLHSNVNAKNNITYSIMYRRRVLILESLKKKSAFLVCQTKLATEKKIVYKTCISFHP